MQHVKNASVKHCGQQVLHANTFHSNPFERSHGVYLGHSATCYKGETSFFKNPNRKQSLSQSASSHADPPPRDNFVTVSLDQLIVYLDQLIVSLDQLIVSLDQLTVSS
jgi:hypothetical protein